MDSFIRAHVHMYQYFGGVATRLICDNLKTGVVLFIQVSFIAAAFPFLEAAVVKGIKFSGYGSLQLIKGAEHFIPEPGDDCGCNLADSPLHGCFLFGPADSRRHVNREMQSKWTGQAR